ncbi:MAG: hypothetical protein IJQ39_14590 [Thermoguttaceae bacterium]|nr:hypothetical protein [Thermoguttaceae bacterium]
MNCKRLLILLLTVFSLIAFRYAYGAELTMKDGRVLNGKLGTLHEIGEEPETGPTIEAQTIVFLDDNLRRVYVPRFQIANVNQDDPLDVSVKFLLPQRIKSASRIVSSVGFFSKKTPFDKYGRRTLTMATASGPVDVIQGITELTPEYVKVEGITHTWDMRISTSSIPTPVLDAILQQQISQGNVDGVVKVARFYIQLQQYHNAVRVMKAALAQENVSPETRKKFEETFQAVKQMESRQLLEELNAREEAGQYELVSRLISNFPVDGVSSEILQQVRRKVQEIEQVNQQKQDVLDNLKKLYQEMPGGEEKTRLAPLLREIVLNLNRNTLDRMAAFEQTLDDNSLQPDEHISLAVSGWLLGAQFATSNIAVSLSAYRVRGLIEQYMSAENEFQRTEVFKKFKMEEASSVKTVSHILSVMEPPEAVEANSRITDDFYRITCRNIFDDSELEYFVQLPPEYDPHRKYPTIVTLHGEFSTPQMQIDWWAGAINEKGVRNGQAGRQGYIVIAPAWTPETTRAYDYSGSSHGAVLGCLQDACRHFSIDSDRVYLSGFSIGATAAWDIAIAHPDLWAGVLPVGPLADRFLLFCGFNARYMPTYFVFGQFDNSIIAKNATRLLNGYFLRNFDVTMVEYQGRGHEDFQEEILKMMDWMKRHKRNFYPSKFECRSIRTFDNFFWNLEQSHFPPKKTADPVHWPPPRGTTAAITSCEIRSKVSLLISTSASKLTIWLNPNNVDFDKKLIFIINGKKQATVTANGGKVVKMSTEYIEPDLRVLLEDVRTRGDRQNPFWAKVDISR